jgi:uncharacterized protein (UPF0276 family)
LLPLPYTDEAVDVVVERARRIQDYLEVPFALENTSSYLTFTASTMSEWQFITEIAERADIGLLFDVNNVYVSAFNHGFDPFEFVRSVPHERIVQIHVAGHTHRGTHLIDTHRGPVIDAVWALYRATLERTGPVPTLIEWDDEIPELPVVLAEAGKARAIRDAVEAGRAGAAPGPSDAAPSLASPVAAAPQHAQSPWTQGGPREVAGGDVVEGIE